MPNLSDFCKDELNLGSTFWRGHFGFPMRNIQSNPHLWLNWKSYRLDGQNLTSKRNGSFQCNSEFDNVSRLCNIRCLIFLTSAQVKPWASPPKNGAQTTPYYNLTIWWYFSYIIFDCLCQKKYFWPDHSGNPMLFENKFNFYPDIWRKLLILDLQDFFRLKTVSFTCGLQRKEAVLSFFLLHFGWFYCRNPW